LDPSARSPVVPLTELVVCSTVVMRMRLRVFIRHARHGDMPDHPITLAFERLVPLYAHGGE